MREPGTLYGRVKPISEWGPECRRGLRYADAGTTVSGQTAVKKISKGRKHRGLASDDFKAAPKSAEEAQDSMD